jgi:hypothetical protein
MSHFIHHSPAFGGCLCLYLLWLTEEKATRFHCRALPLALLRIYPGLAEATSTNGSCREAETGHRTSRLTFLRPKPGMCRRRISTHTPQGPDPGVAVCDGGGDVARCHRGSAFQRGEDRPSWRGALLHQAATRRAICVRMACAHGEIRCPRAN